MIRTLIGIVIFLMVGLIILISDNIFSHNEYYCDGTVIKTNYQPAQIQTGVGYGNTSNGGSGVVVTTSSSPDEYILFLSTNKGTIKAQTNMDNYLKLKKGNEIKIYIERGGIIGINWGFFAY